MSKPRSSKRLGTRTRAYTPPDAASAALAASAASPGGDIEYITPPFAIAVDTREQLPWSFAGMTPHRAKPVRAGQPIRTQVYAVDCVPTTLNAGDYSIVGCEAEIAVERKSKGDLFGTIGQGRERFQRELERLNAMQFAAVIVECEWHEIFHNPPEHTQLSPKTISRSVFAWQQRFPRVHWHFWWDREHAMRAAWRVLERFWIEKQAAEVRTSPEALDTTDTTDTEDNSDEHG